MTPDATTQLHHLLTKARHVLILLPERPSGDVFCAGFAYAHFLTKKNITNTIAFADPEKKAALFSFLPAPAQIIHTLSGARDLVLSFATTHNNILAVRTERTENTFDIYVTPERGSIDPRDFSFVPALFAYDLVIALGASDKESFGALFDENPDLFFEVPVVNIDCHSTNDNYGKLNIVQVATSSVSEMCADLFLTMDRAAVDERVAQCLLTGIITATDSFQKSNTTPKALQYASTLIDLGAQQQHIVKHLYKTQPLSLLKLWGHVMAHLQWEDQLHMAWSSVSAHDFATSGASVADVPLVIEKIKHNHAAAKIFLVLCENSDGTIRGLVDFSRLGNDQLFPALWHGEHKETVYAFVLESKTLPEAEREILTKLMRQD